VNPINLWIRYILIFILVSISEAGAGEQIFNVNKFKAEDIDDDQSAIFLKNVSAASIRECDVMPGTYTFIHISGKESRRIVLMANDFSDAKNPVVVEETVLQSAVKKVSNIIQ
jgi:hypothetical protein